jgi:hypothetical protein
MISEPCQFFGIAPRRAKVMDPQHRVAELGRTEARVREVREDVVQELLGLLDEEETPPAGG